MSAVLNSSREWRTHAEPESLRSHLKSLAGQLEYFIAVRSFPNLEVLYVLMVSHLNPLG